MPGILLLTFHSSLTAGADYTPINEFVSFPPGTEPQFLMDRRQCFSFIPINDLKVEYDEDILLLASVSPQTCNVQFTQAGGNSATINILDDDRTWQP